MSYNVVVSPPVESILSKISRYEANMSDPDNVVTRFFNWN
jgi:hypothetical protein